MPTAAEETFTRIEYLARVMKAPRIRQVAQRLADQAVCQSWTGPQYLQAVLKGRGRRPGTSGARLRLRAAGFPAVKTLEEFDFDHQPSADRSQLHRLAAGGYLTEAGNVVFLGPPTTGKTHLATALGVAACHQQIRVGFNTAAGWVTRLQTTHQMGQLQTELRKSLPAATPDHRRGWLSPLRRRRSELVIPTGRLALRDQLDHPDQQPALFPLGRSLRRPSRCRRHDRPHCPPRRSHHSQGRVLPATQHQHDHPAFRSHPETGRLDNTNKWFPFRPSSTSLPPTNRLLAHPLTPCCLGNSHLSG